ncbi:DinB family protein [Heyndrickxia ginsengihumi]|uniref:Damage-inducible protein DinB n=1 Tax=Heyndrickxia ginsengihumi TaxID=363870 RepID=A0A6M0P9Q2_9BACI|nr:DinB family protein [Heyndrickxia ginsengihumi]NEY21512.1 damage-inducible protein DinB [Heyndrickxia ginsengihumi]
MNELAKQLVRYHIWANQQLISHLKTLPSELFHTKVESVFPTLAETFGHIISVDYVWLSRINKEKPSKIQKWTFQTVAEVEKALSELKMKYKLMFQKEDDITRMVSYKNTKGELFTQTLFELIQHIVNHGTYHRGNLAAMIRQLGYQGTSTDYITFLRIQNS